MKRVLSGLLLLLAGNGMLSGADLTTISGKVYENAELHKIAAGCVQIVHDNGSATIAWDDLPESFIAALNTRQRNDLLNLADIKLKNGKLLQRCTLEFPGESLVVINHLKGSEKIKLDDLPENLVAVFSRAQIERIQGRATAQDAGNKKSVQDKPTGEKRPDGKEIYQGPRGGRYYINDSGRKVYIRNKK